MKQKHLKAAEWKAKSVLDKARGRVLLETMTTACSESFRLILKQRGDSHERF